MTKFATSGVALALSILLASLIFACGKSANPPAAPASGDGAGIPIDSVESGGKTAPVGGGWPSELPDDRPQPWEKLDENGYVIASGGDKDISSINTDTEFAAGVERYIEFGDVTDFGEASRFASGAAGARSVSWALYRLSMGAGQPGVVAADVNPLPAGGGLISNWYAGISDYGNGTWKWYGPFSDSHVRISIPQGDFTSQIGNTFVAIVAFDGAAFDVVGVGANPRDDSDASAPPAPGTPTVTAAAGGVVVEWPDVVAIDLAGYRLYFSNDPFSQPDDAGVGAVGYLLAQPRFFLPEIGDEVIVGLTAVDVSGNESALSPTAGAVPLPGDPPSASLQTDAAGGKRAGTITLTATGGETYDFDIDGDGVFDLTNTTGTALADTSNTGIIRPAVRCTNSGGGVSFAAVSLIITSNSRPLAEAHVSPSTGVVPFSAFFNGFGWDDDGTIAEWAWDTDGDGNYEYTSSNDPEAPPYEYTYPGLFSARFRVTDDQGSFDVDTAWVLANPAGGAANQLPSASLDSGAQFHQAGSAVIFDASGSVDPDGVIERYDWDFDGDFLWDKTSDLPVASHIYTGYYDGTASVRVTDDGGASETATIPVRINVAPYAIGIANPDEAENGQTILLDASGSFDSDGQVTLYEWDVDNNGEYEVNTGTSPYYQIADYPSGRFTVGFRVTDDLQGQGEGTIFFIVKGWSALYSVAGTEDSFHSMALVYGRPAISFYNWSDSDLMYTRNQDEFGYSWTQPVTVDSGGVVGRDSSLAVVNGFPAIAYLDQGNTALKYCRALDEIGNSWGMPVTVDNAGDVGEKPCLLVVGGRPAIAYIDIGNSNLKYVRANDENGATWGSPVTPDNSGTVGVGSVCMMMVYDRPAISYYNDSTKDIMYVRAAGQYGTSWGAPITVDSTEDLGRFNSMAMVDGRPAIAYYNETQNWIQYSRAADFNGVTWGGEVPITHADDIGQYLSLAVINGYPMIAFYNATETDCYLVEAYFRDGSEWQTPFQFLSSSDYGKYTNLIEYYGQPAIATFDNTFDQIVFIRKY
ncbi:MAG: hypothetical protein HRF49_00955 [bacterium]|jgi:hypothetical protein